MQIQSEFLKSQFTNAGQHMQQIINEIIICEGCLKAVAALPITA
jgi:hypothetical protein